MKLTKEQKQFLIEVGTDKNPQEQVKQMFPKLFKEDLKEPLEIGKWYKYKGGYAGYLMVWNERKPTYGFWRGYWDSNLSFIEECNKIPATDEEVKEALIIEAKNRGFKKGVIIKYHADEINSVYKREVGSCSLRIDNNSVFAGEDCLQLDAAVVYCNGQWAEIIENTYTKEEAEKEFNIKIV